MVLMVKEENWDRCRYRGKKNDRLRMLCIVLGRFGKDILIREPWDGIPMSVVVVVLVQVVQVQVQVLVGLDAPKE